MNREDAEDVLVLVVLRLDPCRDRRGRRTNAKIDCLCSRDVRELRQRHAAGVAANQDVDFFFSRQLADGVDPGFGILGFVGDNHFQFTPEDAAFGVDILDRHFHGFLGVAAHLQLNCRGDADLDRRLGEADVWKG